MKTSMEVACIRLHGKSFLPQTPLTRGHSCYRRSFFPSEKMKAHDNLLSLPSSASPEFMLKPPCTLQEGMDSDAAGS